MAKCNISCLCVFFLLFGMKRLVRIVLLLHSLTRSLFEHKKRLMERKKGRKKNTERVQALLLLLRRPEEINPNTFKYTTTRDGPDRLPLTSLKKKNILFAKTASWKKILW